jgi:preprotein translocase subunit SecD
MKKIIQFAGLLLLATAAIAKDPSNAPVFQLRLVADAPSNDTGEMTRIDKVNGVVRKEVFNVDKKIQLDQTALRAATVHEDNHGHFRIDIEFTDDGRKRFAEVTRQNIRKRLAIIIDGKLCSAPVIMSEISGGKAQITGSFSRQEGERSRQEDQCCYQEVRLHQPH